MVATRNGILNSVNDNVWNQIKKDHKKLIWTSRSDDENRAWHYERADGSFSRNGRSLFYYGIHDVGEVESELKKLEEAGLPLEGYHKSKINYSALGPKDLEKLELGQGPGAPPDAYVMALPNGVCKPFVEAVQKGGEGKKDGHAKIVDLSADYRFDDAWTYGLPGAGTKAGEKSSGSGPAPTVPKISGESLKGGVKPYALTDHIHERESGRHLSRSVGLEDDALKLAFIPSVAPWFQGIISTVSAPLKQKMTAKNVREIYEEFYQGEKLVKIRNEVPEVKVSYILSSPISLPSFSFQ
ncbi:hypothetical protein L7F22_046102 [Adiantum nelumboides]|nr:hypothetical protein [Adiantum nelumboides]